MKNNAVLYIFLSVFLILFLAVIGVLVYGGTHNWFQFNFNMSQQPPPANLEPSPQAPVYTSCNQVCSNYGFSKYSTFINSCKEGESEVTYGYQGQPPLLRCCCWNEEIPNTPTCTDTDGGKMFNIGGKVTTALGSMYDTCQPNGMDLLEFYCEGVPPVQKSTGIGCANGCIDSANGDYCSPTKIWHSGDIVFQNSGGGAIAGSEIALGEINLNDYGFNTGGTCRLGAEITTNWVYATGLPTCSGIQGQEGIDFKFFDSNGLEYSRIDSFPSPPITINLHPETHILQWDGVHNWAGTMSKTLNLPACVISYTYSIKIYVYDC